MSLRKRLLIFPLSSFSTLPLHPFAVGTNDFIHGRLTTTFLSYLNRQKKEGRLIELGACNCYPLYSLIEEIHFNNSEDSLPSLSFEDRCILYLEIQARMQGNKTYSKFFNSLCNLYNMILKKYERTHSIDDLFSETISFLSLLFLSFQFKSSLHEELAKKVIEKGFFRSIFSDYSGKYYKFVHFLFCGVPIYNYIFSPLQDTKADFIVDGTVNDETGLIEGGNLDFFIFPFSDDYETIVYFSHIPIYIVKEEK